MAVGKWHAFSELFERMANAEIDFGSDTFKAIILGAGYTPDQNGDGDLADVVASEIADSGYARVTLSGIAIARVSGQTRINWDSLDFGDDVSLTGKYIVIYDDTHADDALVCICDLNTAGTSATVSSTSGDFDINTAAADELTITPVAYSAGN